MKHIALALIAASLMGGCMSSSSNSSAREPNYVQAQIYQSPAPYGNTLGNNSIALGRRTALTDKRPAALSSALDYAWLGTKGSIATTLPSES